MNSELDLKRLTPSLVVALSVWLERTEAEISLLRQARQCYPANYLINFNLGKALTQDKANREQLTDGIAYYRVASAIRPNSVVYNNLGVALGHIERSEEAIYCFQQAIELNPQYHAAHANLGRSLMEKGRLDEAIDWFQRAIDLNPKAAITRNNLGLIWEKKGKLDKAIACYREAMALAPNEPFGFNNLGHLHAKQGDYDQAIGYLLQSIKAKPTAQAHLNLGKVYHNQGKYAEAIETYRKSIAINPKLAEAQGDLGASLYWQGQFSEASMCAALALSYAHPRDAQRSRYEALLERCKKMLLLSEQLPAVLAGSLRSSIEDRLQLAWVCSRPSKQLYAEAVRLYSDAFSEEPTQADDLDAGRRHQAACAAVLAAFRHDQDPIKLGETERGRFRQTALAWLQADLALWKRAVQTSNPKRRAMRMELLRRANTPALAAVRDPAALANLPAPERQAWQQLWADVRALRAQSSKDTNP